MFHIKKQQMKKQNNMTRNKQKNLWIESNPEMRELVEQSDKTMLVNIIYII